MRNPYISFRFIPLIWRKLHFFIPGDVWFYRVLDSGGHHLGTTDCSLPDTTNIRSFPGPQFVDDVSVFLKDLLE